MPFEETPRRPRGVRTDVVSGLRRLYGTLPHDRMPSVLGTPQDFLAIQECIDLAAHWVADAGWGSPDEAGATFRVLMSRGAIDYELATKLRNAVNLRNRIAHDYSRMAHERLQAEYRDGAEALRQFLTLVADEADL